MLSRYLSVSQMCMGCRSARSLLEKSDQGPPPPEHISIIDWLPAEASAFCSSGAMGAKAQDVQSKLKRIPNFIAKRGREPRLLVEFVPLDATHKKPIRSN